MSQRNSGYDRKEADFYPTPDWVTRALVPFIPQRVRRVWEPAAGGGHMADALRAARYEVVATDLATGRDFLIEPNLQEPVDAIITNPPFAFGREFCEQALRFMEARQGVVAMLFRTDFGHAKSRAHLFRDCPAWAKKIELLDRIVWFVEENGKPKKSPSINHAWFVWDWRNEGPPEVVYAVNDQKKPAPRDRADGDWQAPPVDAFDRGDDIGF